MRHVIFIILCVVFLSGCWEARPAWPAHESEAALPTDVAGLTKELQKVRSQERVLLGAIDDAKNEAAQSKLWVGAGTCFLACLILVALGIWTTRRLLVQIGLGVGALGGLLIFAAWLVPYALYIGLGVGTLVAIGAVYMLINRERALRQVTTAVGEIKSQVPGYREIFRAQIDERSDAIINSIRGVKK